VQDNARPIKAHLLLITGLIAAVYINSLGNAFTLDDNVLITSNPTVHGFNSFTVKMLFSPFADTPFYTRPDYYPLRDLTYMLDYELWELRPQGYHMMNLIYYIFLCLMFYLTAGWLSSRWAGCGPSAALLATVLFAVHPIHVEAVASISQRKDLVSGAFFFLSLYLFLLYRDKGRPVLYIISVLTFALSMLAKTTAISLPVLVLMVETLYPGKRGRPLSWLPYALVGGAVMSVSYIAMKEVYQGIPEVPSLSTLVYASALSVFAYIKKLLLPWPLTILNVIKLPGGLSDPTAALSLSGIALLVYLVIRHRSERPVFSFSIAFFMITLMPMAAFIASRGTLPERYAFLPSAGFCLLLGVSMERLLAGRFRRYVLAIFISIVLAFSGVTIYQNRIWKDGVTLFSHALGYEPRSPDLHMVLAREYFVLGQYDKAFSHFEMAENLDPDSCDPEFFRAYHDFLNKDYSAALARLDALKSRCGHIVEVNYLYGKAYEYSGKLDKSLSYYRKAASSPGKLRFEVFKRENAVSRAAFVEALLGRK
jgi:hypothetical protein